MSGYILHVRDDLVEERIALWLDVSPNQAVLRAKHAKDLSDQAVAFVAFTSDGHLSLWSIRLFAPNLCAAFGIATGEAPKLWRKSTPTNEGEE